jgi:DNA-binding Lrp family transcriptional regulator
MPAKRKTQEYVKNELPYALLMSLYEDSRASLRGLGKRFRISYHVVNSVLEELEGRYDIKYTLELDETKLGFAEGKIITIRFGIKPGIDFIKERIRKDFFIQDAYLAEGDFDLLLYVVGVEPTDFQKWQWTLRVSLSRYKPVLKFSNVSTRIIGFFPIKSSLIRESKELSKGERAVLALLNDNSRMRLSEIAKRLRMSPDKVVYLIKKLREMGAIKRFTALTQNPDKRILYAYGSYVIPTEGHKELAIAMAKEIVNEDFHETVNDYAITADMNGNYDFFAICAFKNGETLSRRGPEFMGGAWLKEDPVIDKALLTDIIVGKWPFHLENYSAYRIILENLLSKKT